MTLILRRLTGFEEQIMKKLIIASIFTVLATFTTIYANTPTEALTKSVNELISIAGNSDYDEASKKSELTKIIASTVDFEAVSRRVVSKPWRKATDDQKQQFKDNFLVIMTNTYFALLKDYDNEQVEFTKEQIKSKKYALVDTFILSGNKKIPVRYRLIKSVDTWKIYDFVPEGISIVTTYKNNYKSIISKKGISGLLEEMKLKEQQKTSE